MPWIAPAPVRRALLAMRIPLPKLFTPLRTLYVALLLPLPTVNKLLLMNAPELLSVPALNVMILPALVATRLLAQTVPPLISSWLLSVAPDPTVMFRFDTKPPADTLSRLLLAAPKPIVIPCPPAPSACQTPEVTTLIVLLEVPPPIVLAELAAFVKV